MCFEWIKNFKRSFFFNFACRFVSILILLYIWTPWKNASNINLIVKRKQFEVLTQTVLIGSVWDCCFHCRMQSNCIQSRNIRKKIIKKSQVCLFVFFCRTSDRKLNLNFIAKTFLVKNVKLWYARWHILYYFICL